MLSRRPLGLPARRGAALPRRRIGSSQCKSMRDVTLTCIDSSVSVVWWSCGCSPHAPSPMHVRPGRSGVATTARNHLVSQPSCLVVSQCKSMHRTLTYIDLSVTVGYGSGELSPGVACSYEARNVLHITSRHTGTLLVEHELLCWRFQKVNVSQFYPH